MKVLLIYYTGTFNTRYLTQKVKARFEDQGDQVNVVEINDKTPVCDCDGYDLIGFSYPIYGFNTPKPFNKYVKQLKFNKGQNYFIYKNSGETLKINNASSRILKRLMKRQGCMLKGEYHFVMPYNIMFKFDDRFVKQIFNQNKKLMDVMFYNLKNGVVKELKSNLFYNIGAFIVGIQKPFSNFNARFYKVDFDKCVKCMKCVQNCPRSNVSLVDDKIKFNHHCDMCMRCSFYCPTDAINIGLLQGWKVNGAYDFEKIEKDDSIVEPYVTKKSKGFYKCFIKYFEQIDEEHKRIFG